MTHRNFSAPALLTSLSCTLKAVPLATVLLASVESISLMKGPLAGGSKVLSLCLAAGSACTRHYTSGSYFDCSEAQRCVTDTSGTDCDGSSKAFLFNPL